MKGRGKARAVEPEVVQETEPGGAPDTLSDLPEEVEDPPESEPEPKKPLKPATYRPARIISEIANAEHQELKDWLDSIGPQGSFQVAVSRTAPESFRDQVTGEDHPVGGHLYTYEKAVSEDDISRDWGGGDFSLRVKTRNEKGSFVYANHRVVKIAG